MNSIKLLSCCLLSFFIVSCGNQIEVTGRPIPSSTVNTVHLVCDHELDGLEVHNAVKNELKKSGYRVVDLKSNQHSKVNGPVLHYNDVWGWDMVTLIRSLDVKIVDGKSGYIISQAHYKQLGTWPYPEVNVVVKSLFDEMRAKGTLR